MKLLRSLTLGLLFCIVLIEVLWGGGPSSSTYPSPSSAQSTRWADSVLQRMSLSEKVGQLMMIDVYGNKPENYTSQIASVVKRYHLGGIIMMQGDIGQQRRVVQALQNAAKVPLMVAMDAEWGTAMRLSDGPSFPKQMTLGAIRHDSLLYQLGKEFAWQLGAVGAHVNFSPVLDVNNNARNPVIHARSFGENPYRVARKGIALGRGMQAGGVMAVGKHFPGHGDTDTDSHRSLPVISHSAERLDSLELYPFRKAAEAGLGGMMIGHLHVPSLDDRPNRPASLSKTIISDVLRKRLGFKGLVFSDALNMKGVTAHFPGKGTPALEALKAGNDILLFPEQVGASIQRIVSEVQKGAYPEAALDAHVRRVLLAKYKLGLSKPQRVPTTYTVDRPEAQLLRQRLYESALTLLKNEATLIPFQNLGMRFALIQAGNELPHFTAKLKTYTAVRGFGLPNTLGAGQSEALAKQLGQYETVIISIPGDYSARSRYGIPGSVGPVVEALRRKGKKVVLAYFGSPYGLKHLPDADAILMGYETKKEAQVAAAAALFGGLSIHGTLPVGAGMYNEGMGIITPKPFRYGFSIPEGQGLDSRVMMRIDSLANHFIQRGAMPGCAILVGKGNDIVYAKGFGHTEPGGSSIDPYYHTYDLASVTKVAATTLCAMKFTEEGLLSLDRPLSKYIDDFRGTNKARLTPRRLLQHNAGLPAWRPFFKDTYSDPVRKIPDPRFYDVKRRDSFRIQISEKLYATPALHDTLWEWIKDMEVANTTRVRYSDIGLLLTQRVLESISGGTQIDRLASMYFYKDLGMVSTGFRPAMSGLEKRCPPSAIDNYWRREKLKGYVHDECAAVFGGVAGHAGLFSNTYDLAKMLFMLKNGGTYGGQQFLLPETIRAFTKQQLTYNRKGLGWDKPEPNPKRSNPCSQYASPETFGHTGFTGTCVWVDPTNDIVFVFLSNRTYPNPQHKLLNREAVRQRIFDVVYDAQLAYDKRHPLPQGDVRARSRR